jgi:hypothetical protein
MLKHSQTIHTVSLLLGWSKNRVDAALAVLAFADRLMETRGPVNTVAYLKEAHRCLTKALGGTPERKCATAFPIGLDKAGFPKLLPRAIRVPATEGSALDRMIALFILSIYREMIIPGQLRLDTVEKPCTVDLGAFYSSVDWSGKVRDFVDLLGSFGYQPSDLSKLRWEHPHVTNKSGPNGPAMMNSYIDAAHLVAHPLWETFRRYAQLTHSTAVLPLVQRLAKYAWRWRMPSARVPIPRLGRISTKEEAAGKVRIFALVDYWTQTLLKQLHSHLYEVLRLIPTDCTFDQQSGVRRAALAAYSGVQNFWSFDLSAATDRFPVRLQTELLASIFRDPGAYEFAELWRKLLVGRTYAISAEDAKKIANGDDFFMLGPNRIRVKPLLKKEVRYACGQPMGAYSSWAVFALSHHALVQLAARLAGHKGWWYNYQLLGDDLVLWGDDVLSERVASEYLSLARRIGVAVNLSKSLVSDQGVFEFAKTLVVKGETLTPFHLKEWNVAFKTPQAFVGFISLMLERKVVVTPLRAVLTWFHDKGLKLSVAALRKTFNVWPKHVVQLVILLFSPVGPFPMSVKPWSQVLSGKFRDLGDMDVAWPTPPVAKASDGAVIKHDCDHVLIREALWEEWELAAKRLASQCFNTPARRQGAIEQVLTDAWRRGCELIEPLDGSEKTKAVMLLSELLKSNVSTSGVTPEEVARLLSIHPWWTESERIWRTLWKDGLPYVYKDVAAAGMQDASWWIGEDLPDDLTPGGIVQASRKRSERPLEEFLSSPSPEVLGLSMPSLLSEREQEQKFRSSIILKAFKAMGRKFVLSQDDRPEPVNHQVYLQPTTPVPAKPRPMSTRESYLVAALGGEEKWCLLAFSLAAYKAWLVYDYQERFRKLREERVWKPSSA